MLQNAYLLTKIGADTAENEQHFAEILPILPNGKTMHRRIMPARRGGAAKGAGAQWIVKHREQLESMATVCAGAKVNFLGGPRSERLRNRIPTENARKGKRKLNLLCIEVYTHYHKHFVKRDLTLKHVEM